MSSHPDDLYAFWTELHQIKAFSEDIDNHQPFSPAQQALAVAIVVYYRRVFDRKWRRSVTGVYGTKAFGRGQWPLDVKQLGSDDRAIHDWLAGDNGIGNKWVPPTWAGSTQFNTTSSTEHLS